MPLTVSVVIPYYNDSHFIDDAVASVLAQTQPPNEVIIVDDCSREEEFQYLRRFESTCIVVRNKRNMGLAAARNAGVARAGSEWIALLDSDDLWEPAKLEKQLCYVEEHPDCVAVHTAVRRQCADGTEMVFRKRTACLEDFLYAVRSPVIPSSVMIKRSEMLINGLFDPTQRFSEDRDFFLRFCCHNRIHCIDEPLLIRRERPASLARRLEQMWVHGDRINRKYRHLFPDLNRYRQALLQLNADFLARAMQQRAWGLAWRVMRQITARDVSAFRLATLAARLFCRDRWKNTGG